MHQFRHSKRSSASASSGFAVCFPTLAVVVSTLATHFPYCWIHGRHPGPACYDSQDHRLEFKLSKRRSRRHTSITACNAEPAAKENNDPMSYMELTQELRSTVGRGGQLTVSSFPRGRRISAARWQASRQPSPRKSDNGVDTWNGRRLAATAAISAVAGFLIGTLTDDSEVRGDGPYPLFVMRSGISVGDLVVLNFFEPRYRWMCREIVAGPKPYYFGLINSGLAAPGNVGVLCEMRNIYGGEEISESFDGTFRVAVLGVSEFKLLDVWTLQVPSGPDFPELSVGTVEFLPSSTR